MFTMIPRMNLLLLCMLSLALVGCAKIKHLPQLLTLKSYSDNGDEKDRLVNQGNAFFEQLKLDVSEQRLSAGMEASSILDRYGDPILRKEVVEGESKLSRWLYRYPVKKSRSDKVYLYFDHTNKLAQWKFVPYVPQEPKAP